MRLQMSPSSLATALLLSSSLSSLTNAQLFDMTISGQAIYSTLPAWMAKQLGFFEELGLNVNLIYYPSGAPQVQAAVDSQAWDIGDAGCVPNIVGSVNDIETIAISNDASAANALLGNGAAVGAAGWPPMTMEGVPVGITPNSTGHYAALKCLTDAYPEYTSDGFVYEQQQDIIDGMSGGSYDYGGLWAPNMYTVLNTVADSEVLCSGETANAKVPSGVMVREAFAMANPEMVHRAMAAWMRAIAIIQNPDNRGQVLEWMNAFYTEQGITLNEADLEKEIDLRPMYNLTEQLALMDNVNGQPSEMETWYAGVAAFMEENGVLTNIPPEQDYIEDDYLDAINENATLRAFALNNVVVGDDAPVAAPTGGAPTGGDMMEPTMGGDGDDATTMEPTMGDDMGGNMTTMEPTMESMGGGGGDMTMMTDVTISGQAIYSTLPAWMAVKHGYFEELGLNVTMIYYPSGAPQVADKAAWHIGDAGCVPNIVGSVNDIETIAISNDASAANALLGNTVGAAGWPPALAEDVGPVGITANSTGHYAALKCLTDEYPDYDDSGFVYEGQSDIVTNMDGDPATYNYGGLWAPNMYTVLNQDTGSAVLCSGETAGAKVPSGVMINDEWGDNNKDTASMVLTGWMRAISVIQDSANRDAVLEDMKEFYMEQGIELSQEDMEKEIDLRPMYNLMEQLTLMDEGGDAHTWYAGVAAFMEENGVLTNIPPTTNYLEDEYLKMIEMDANMKAYAQSSDIKAGNFVPDMDMGDDMTGGGGSETDDEPTAGPPPPAESPTPDDEAPTADPTSAGARTAAGMVAAAAFLVLSSSSSTLL